MSLEEYIESIAGLPIGIFQALKSLDVNRNLRLMRELDIKYQRT